MVFNKMFVKNIITMLIELTKAYPSSLDVISNEERCQAEKIFDFLIELMKTNNDNMKAFLYDVDDPSVEQPKKWKLKKKWKTTM